MQLDWVTPLFSKIFLYKGGNTDNLDLYVRNNITIRVLIVHANASGPCKAPEKRINVLARSSYRPSGFMSSDMGFQSASRVTSADG